MEKFKPLMVPLEREKAFEKELAELSEFARSLIERVDSAAAGMPRTTDWWDAAGPETRRKVVCQYEIQHNPANQADHDRAWRLNAEIEKWEELGAPTVSDELAKERRLIELRRELDEVEDRMAVRVLGAAVDETHGDPAASPDPESRDASRDEAAIKRWLMSEQARRIEGKIPHGLNEVRLYLPKEFRHLSRDDVDRLYEGLDSCLKPKPGPKGPWKNKRSDS